MRVGVCVCGSSGGGVWCVVVVCVCGVWWWCVVVVCGGGGVWWWCVVVVCAGGVEIDALQTCILSCGQCTHVPHSQKEQVLTVPRNGRRVSRARMSHAWRATGQGGPGHHIHRRIVQAESVDRRG